MFFDISSECHGWLLWRIDNFTAWKHILKRFLNIGVMGTSEDDAFLRSVAWKIGPGEILPIRGGTVPSLSVIQSKNFFKVFSCMTFLYWKKGFYFLYQISRKSYLFYCDISIEDSYPLLIGSRVDSLLCGKYSDLFESEFDNFLSTRYRDSEDSLTGKYFCLQLSECPCRSCITG